MVLAPALTCSCQGPYAGPDAIPDYFELGHQWGDIDSSGAIRDTNYMYPTDGHAEADLWTVTLGWEITSDPLVRDHRAEETRELLRAMAEAEPVAIAQEKEAEGAEGLLLLVRRYPVELVLLLLLAPLGMYVYSRWKKADSPA
jgi:hypothetical protein